MNVQLCRFITTDEQRDYIKDILDSTRFTEGKYTKLFENTVKEYLGAGHVISVSNGTTALELVANYLKRYHFKETQPLVCVPGTTFPATLNAFLNAGYRYTFCDIDEETLCMDIDTLSEQTKQDIDVIVPVSLLGHAPDMDKIMEQSEKYDWIVVEDFAEAFGTSYKGKKLGTIGHFGTSSFYMSHVVSGGELGVVISGSDETTEILRSMKNHGRTGSNLEFLHSYIGSNYKTNEFCSAIAYSQVKIAGDIVKKRNNIAERFKTGIIHADITTYPFSKEFSYLGYPLIAATNKKRQKFIDSLTMAGIETRTMFPCLPFQEAYGLPQEAALKLPRSLDAQERAFYIPVHQHLTDEEVTLIIGAINGVEK